MTRPFIVCNMITSINGKIVGKFWYDNEVGARGLALYNEKHFYRNPNGYMSGSITAAKLCGEHEMDLRENVPPQPREDHVVMDNAECYYVALDVEGTIPWASNTVEYAGRPASHVIELLTEDVSDAYIDFLNRRNVSYIFCGKKKDAASMTMAAEKLYSLFHVTVLKCGGGGGLNWAFQREGLIDELSIFMTPITDGNSDSPSIFERRSLPDEGTFEFKLEAVEVVENDYLWLRYLKK